MDGASTGSGLQAVYALVEVLLVFFAPIGVLIVVLAIIRELGSAAR